VERDEEFSSKQEFWQTDGGDDTFIHNVAKADMDIEDASSAVQNHLGK